ncbi:magnesium chelatase [Pseudomonas sp. ABC1]|uniref:vWA domain-containing protein n=1 Tax=Pseudomonas sp. ABC1 TaxID=2748080 RepID=UPI0015C31A6A|nr:magnesium chelatase [Pseudomonas sp. ABC1]QLF91754.1 magnesium chelatase [Pseudomonas sp. ABC1]
MRLHWPRTLLAKGQAALRPEHLRFRSVRGGARQLHCLLLDCSASMLRGDKLALAKGWLLHCAEDCYRQRADLLVIGFAGQRAWLIQAPRRASANSRGWIAPLGAGGGSPVDAALTLSEREIGNWRKRHPGGECGLWLLSDARFRQVPPCPDAADFHVVVDFENDSIALGRAERIAQTWQAEYVRAVLTS